MIEHGCHAKKVLITSRTWFTFALGLSLTFCMAQPHAFGQALEMPGEIGSSSVSSSSVGTVSPAQQPFSVDSVIGEAGHSTMNSSGAYYNPILGAHIRARYSTQSYGQDRGNLDLGTMKIWDQGDSVSFFDGQITLNEESHVGYNLGLGYRWMSLPMFPFSADDEKIMGVSLWADGQGAGGDNFFPQIGASFEMLGDRVDFRANGYLPVGPESKDRDFQTTGDEFFTGNNIADQLVGIRDTSLSVLEGELAGRISNYDAWVFGGVYGFTGGDNDEVGGKIGLRGYATPDLSLSIALTNDALFDTNAVFSATWFIGRTRRENCPTGQLRDRFREPVIRNDYVAMAQTSVIGATSIKTDENGDALIFRHFNSDAVAGGDGTAENPYSTLASNSGTGSNEGDNLVLHAGSEFNNDTLELKDNQDVFSEGVFDDMNALTDNTNIAHSVIGFGGEIISLPETREGAFEIDSAKLINNGTIAEGVILADNTSVNNLVINGGVKGITANIFDGTVDPIVNGSGDVSLQNITISNTTDNGIELTAASRSDGTTTTMEMDVDIDNVFLSDIGGAFGILIDAEDNDFASTNGLAFNESTSINNVDISGGAGVGIGIRNTNNDTTVTTISDYDYTGGATGIGGLMLTDAAGSITVDSASSISGGTGEAIDIDGGSADFTYNGALTNTDGDSVNIQDLQEGSARFTFEGGLDDNGNGIFINNIGDATIEFSSSDSTIANSITTTAAEDAINVTGTTDAASTVIFNDFALATEDGNAIVANADNTDGTVEFNNMSIDTTAGIGNGVLIDHASETNAQYRFNGIEIATTEGIGFSADNANLTVVGGSSITSNTIDTTTGVALRLEDVTINAGLSVTFDQVNVTNGDTNAIFLNDVGEGSVVIGQNTGDVADQSTLNSVAGSAISATDVEDLTINNVLINASGGTAAIDVGNLDTDASSVTLNDITTTAGAIGTALEATQNGDGDLSLTITDSEFDETTGNSVTVAGTTGAVSISDTTIDNSGGSALTFTNAESNITLNTVSTDDAFSDAVTFANIDGDVSATALTMENGSARGIVISDGTDVSDGNFTFDDSSSITDQAGDAFVVEGGTGNITYNGDINNQANQSIAISGRTDGTVNFGPTADIIDNGDGIEITNNTGGTYNLLGDHTLNTGASNAVDVTGNSNVEITFSDLDIDTTTGTGFNIEGDLARTNTIGVNGTTSTITTTAGGIGVNIEDAVIDSTGVTFASVNVTTKATTSAVLIDGTTGGSIAINGGTIADSTNDAIIINDASTVVLDGITVTASDAGAINATDVSLLTVDDVTVTNSTSDAITATNVGTMIMNGTTVTDTGGNALTLLNDDAVNMDIRIDDFTVTAAAAAAINATHTGSGRFDLELDNSNLDEQVAITATGTGALDLFATNTTIDDLDNEVAFFLNMDGGAMNDVDISLSNVDIATGDAIAFDLDAINGTNLNIAFELSNGSSISNDSASSAFDGLIGSSVNLDATILGNTLTNNGGGGPFVLETNNASAQVQMEITGNTFVGGGITLTDNGGDFQVENSATISADNGTVVVSTPGSGTIDEFDETIEVIETPVAND